MLEDALNIGFPRAELQVTSYDAGSTDVPEQLEQLDDVLTQEPSLLIWQVGTQAVVRDGSYSIDYVVDQLAEAIKRISYNAGSTDLLLVNPPYVPALLYDNRADAAERTVHLLGQLGESFGVNVFNRWALMRHWHVHQGISFEQMIDLEDPDKLRLNEWTTRALANSLAGQILLGVSDQGGDSGVSAVNGGTPEFGTDVFEPPPNDSDGAILREPSAFQPPWVDNSAGRVRILFATTRRPSGNAERFSGEREDFETHYGIASVKAPGDRLPGESGRPAEWTLFNINFHRENEDPSRHFVLEDSRSLSKREWFDVARQSHEALIFVHGFNYSFLDGMYTCAQVAWDIRYPGLPILFSWASAASLSLSGYIYDRDSALLARERFISLLLGLQAAGVAKLNIMAHSMGNFLVLDALQNHYRHASDLKLEHLMMAAPDVDAGQYREWIKQIGPMSRGMTLYASSRDKALKVSKKLARGVRAGDVLASGPITVAPVETIDASIVGRDIFGTNHALFASKKSILNDINLLLQGMKAPRLVEIAGMPTGAPVFEWWRFVS